MKTSSAAILSSGGWVVVVVVCVCVCVWVGGTYKHFHEAICCYSEGPTSIMLALIHVMVWCHFRGQSWRSLLTMMDQNYFIIVFIISNANLVIVSTKRSTVTVPKVLGRHFETMSNGMPLKQHDHFPNCFVQSCLFSLQFIICQYPLKRDKSSPEFLFSQYHGFDFTMLITENRIAVHILVTG